MKIFANKMTSAFSLHNRFEIIMNIYKFFEHDKATRAEECVQFCVHIYQHSEIYGLSVELWRDKFSKRSEEEQTYIF